MKKMRLNTNDIVTIQHILQDYVDTRSHTKREGEYPAIFEAILDSMCWDDGIVTDGEVTQFVHG